jgi:protein-S-isoprenylcysteine O-methyltransferase Ste14
MQTEQTFRLLLVAGALMVLPMMAYHRLKARTNEPLDRRQEGLFILLTLRPIGVATLLGLALYLIDPARMAWAAAPFPAWLRWTGIAMGAAGGMLLLWTVHTLGPNLTDTVVTRRLHTLVTAGPYRWVRHPFYDTVTLLALATGLAAANWFVLAGALLLIPLFVVRTPIEEERLVSRFGDAYRTYMAHTGRFLPGVGIPHPRG